MAHFAEVDAAGIVLRVLVVPDDQEHRGQEFMADDLGLGGTWVQTSYNTQANTHRLGGTPLHMNYAGIGSSWDGTGFAPPQPFPSWSLDENYVWQAPIPRPTSDTGFYLWESYKWGEDAGEWVEVVPEVTLGDADNPYPGDGNNPPFYEWNNETREWLEVPE